MFRASGRSEEPAGERPDHQLSEGPLGAGGGRREAVSDHLRPHRGGSGEHGEFHYQCLTTFHIIFYLSISFLSIAFTRGWNDQRVHTPGDGYNFKMCF